MDRCRDYFSFAVWFTGIGYIVLWPLTANDVNGYPFGASAVCGHANGGVMGALCGLPHPLVLPIGLHALGSVAAMLVATRLLCRLLRRLRRGPCDFFFAALNARPPWAILGRSRKSAPRLRSVPPRKHFGLRGLLR